MTHFAVTMNVMTKSAPRWQVVHQVAWKLSGHRHGVTEGGLHRAARALRDEPLPPKSRAIPPVGRGRPTGAPCQSTGSTPVTLWAAARAPGGLVIRRRWWRRDSTSCTRPASPGWLTPSQTTLGASTTIRRRHGSCASPGAAPSTIASTPATSTEWRAHRGYERQRACQKSVVMLKAATTRSPVLTCELVDLRRQNCALAR